MSANVRANVPPGIQGNALRPLSQLCRCLHAPGVSRRIVDLDPSASSRCVALFASPSLATHGGGNDHGHDGDEVQLADHELE
jgi:hypothetical protein